VHRRRDPSLPVAPWFATVLLVSWSFWFAAALCAGIDDPRARRLVDLGLGLGAAAPAALALLALQRWCEPGVRAGLWRRLVDPTRLRAADWVRALLPAPLLLLFAVVLAGATGLPEIAALAPPSAWWAPLFLLLVGPVPEEIAWRGWALDRLQLSQSALGASLVVGAFLMLWHVPLYLVGDAARPGAGLGSPTFWLQSLVLLPQAVVLTWVYNTTRGSLLATVALHWMVELGRQTVLLPVRTELLHVLLWTVFATALVAALGPASLGRESSGAAARMGRGPGRRPGQGDLG